MTDRKWQQDKEDGVNITGEDLTMVRKAMQLMIQAHAIIETADQTDDRETRADALIRRIKEEERRNNDASDHKTAAD